MLFCGLLDIFPMLHLGFLHQFLQLYSPSSFWVVFMGSILDKVYCFRGNNHYETLLIAVLRYLYSITESLRFSGHAYFLPLYMFCTSMSVLNDIGLDFVHINICIDSGKQVFR
jgi:hypothetical protein